MKKLLISAHSRIDKAINRRYYYAAKEYSEHLPEDFTLTFHAGALFTKPNTLESIRTALAYGAEVVEFDVSFRPNGTPVIIHAASPEESEGVLLDSALAAAAKDEKCRINLDIKSTANLPQVDILVRKHGVSDRVFYTGVFRDWVDAVKKSSAIPYYLNHNITAEESENAELLQKLAEEIISIGAIGVNSHFGNATPLVTKIMHGNGLLVSLWTVNKTNDAVKVFSCLPDNITTKNPHLISNML